LTSYHQKRFSESHMMAVVRNKRPSVVVAQGNNQHEAIQSSILRQPAISFCTYDKSEMVERTNSFHGSPSWRMGGHSYIPPVKPVLTCVASKCTDWIFRSFRRLTVFLSVRQSRQSNAHCAKQSEKFQSIANNLPPTI